MSQGSQQTVIVQQAAPTSGLGTAGLVFSVLGWFTCGLLCIPGAALSFLGLFARGPKGAAVAGLIVGFPGVIFFVVAGMGIIGGVLGIGGAARQAADRARREAESRNQAIERPVEFVEEIPADRETVAVAEFDAEKSDGRPVDPAAEETAEENPLTMANYYRVQHGMTYEEVKAILGPANEEMASNVMGAGTQFAVETVMLAWKGSWGANANIMFQNGRVTSKAQFGLPPGKPASEETAEETPAEMEPEPEPKRPAIPVLPPAEMREWSDGSGQFRVQAKFTGMAFGKVKLEREDGQVIQVELEKLSEEDRAWIRARR